MTRTALYRHFDADCRLLYVGVTHDIEQRKALHRTQSHWYSDVCNIQYQWLDSRAHATALEAVAIEFEAPLHNVRRVSVARSDDTAAPLLRDVLNFLSATGMGESYFGKASTGNSELVKRLRAGRQVLPKTEARIRDFISDRIQGQQTVSVESGAA